MDESFVVMTKKEIIDRLSKAKEDFNKYCPAWSENQWKLYYDHNEEQRAKWFHHFGLTPSISLEEFKERARKHYRNHRSDFITIGHPASSDFGPSNVCDTVYFDFIRLVNNSSKDEIYVSSSDVKYLVNYEFACKCEKQNDIYVSRFGWF